MLDLLLNFEAYFVCIVRQYLFGRHSIKKYVFDYCVEIATSGLRSKDERLMEKEAVLTAYPCQHCAETNEA
jgi:hypothetical protein